MVKARDEIANASNSCMDAGMPDGRPAVLENGKSFDEMTSKDYYFDSYAHFGKNRW